MLDMTSLKKWSLLVPILDGSWYEQFDEKESANTTQGVKPG